MAPGGTHMLRHTWMCCKNGSVFCKESLNKGHIFHEKIPMGLISKFSRVCYENLVCFYWIDIRSTITDNHHHCAKNHSLTCLSRNIQLATETVTEETSDPPSLTTTNIMPRRTRVRHVCRETFSIYNWVYFSSCFTSIFWLDFWLEYESAGCVPTGERKLRAV